MSGNKAYLYGKNSIIERLKCNPKSIKNVFIQENFNNPQITSLLRSNSIPHRIVREKELMRIKRADRMQGIAAEVERFEYTPLEALVDTNGKAQYCLLLLDEISDPHNLGSLLRITACLGGFAIVLPRHSSCEVNDTVMHVASGGENFTPVARVSNILNAILKIKKSGYWIAGSIVDGGDIIGDIKLPFPLAVILGSEGRGIKPAILKHVDLNITLQMQGAALSLNVAMAGAMLCYEISRQLSGKPA
jgi:23S rRNA (guanosine2251-2'-O)-methyltransferase